MGSFWSLIGRRVSALGVTSLAFNAGAGTPSTLVRVNPTPVYSRKMEIASVGKRGSCYTCHLVEEKGAARGKKKKKRKATRLEIVPTRRGNEAADGSCRNNEVASRETSRAYNRRYVHVIGVTRKTETAVALRSLTCVCGGEVSVSPFLGERGTGETLPDTVLSLMYY